MMEGSQLRHVEEEEEEEGWRPGDRGWQGGRRKEGGEGGDAPVCRIPAV